MLKITGVKTPGRFSVSPEGFPATF